MFFQRNNTYKSSVVSIIHVLDFRCFFISVTHAFEKGVPLFSVIVPFLIPAKSTTMITKLFIMINNYLLIKCLLELHFCHWRLISFFKHGLTYTFDITNQWTENKISFADNVCNTLYVASDGNSNFLIGSTWMELKCDKTIYFERD